MKYNQSVPQSCFGSYFQKEKIFLFGKESVLPFWKNHPLSEDTKLKLLLCMLLVFCARNVSFSDDNLIFKFFTKGFENLLARFFLIPKICYQVLSSACAMRLHWYFPFGKFYLDIGNKMANNNVTVLPHETEFDISKDCFCWIDIFTMWIEDHQLLYQFFRLLLKAEVWSAFRCNYL